MSAFEKLMAELNGAASDQDTMRKALPAGDGEDDKNIQAAAAEGGGMDGKKVDGAVDGKPNDDDDEDDDDKPLGKSLGPVTLPDGTQVEAVDGTELVKALQDEVKQLGAKQAEGESQMVKALEQCVTLVKGQNAMLKSMQDELTKLRGEGRGRKTVLTVTEKPGAGDQMHKSEHTGMTSAEFMAKSDAAFKAHKITGVEYTTIDVSLRTGSPVNPELIQKVVS